MRILNRLNGLATGLLFGLASVMAQAQVITTVAGTGDAGYFADGVTATSAVLNGPRGMAVDAAGNLFIADTSNHRIRKVSAGGVISTVAGTGAAGFSGDGGAAVQAQLNNPRSVALDGAGNLFIADGGNHRIRKVDANGVISTVAGTASGYAGDGGPATSARLRDPRGLVFDSAGNMYIADTFNRRIRKVDTSGIITTFAGNGSAIYRGDGGPVADATFFLPEGISRDGQGNLFIADINIRKVDGNGIITLVAGNLTYGFSGDGGPATSAALDTPQNAVSDAAGNVYIADRDNHRIRKVSPGGIISTFAGTGTAGFGGDGGPAANAQLNQPQGLTIDAAGNFYIAELNNHRIRKVAVDGTITTIAGNGFAANFGDGVSATDSTLNGPRGMAVDAAGNLFIADTANHRVRKVSASGMISTVAGTGVAGVSGDGGAAVDARLNNPRSVALDGAGNLFIADGGNHRIRKVDANGVITTVAGSVIGYAGDGGPATSARMRDPRGLVFDSAGNMYIADTFNRRIRKVDTSGIITTFSGNGSAGYGGDGGPVALATFYFPEGISRDEQGNLFIADVNIRKVDGNGIITALAGNLNTGFTGDGGPATSATLSAPQNAVSDGAGNVYIADRDNHRIRKVSPNGIISTFAGTGTAGFGGDKGPAANAMLNQPQGLTIDAAGNLYVAELGNHRVRKIALPRPAAPTIGVVTASNASISVSFTPGDDGGSPILDFTATCNSTNPISSSSATATSSPITFTGLTNGVAYRCTVTARNVIASGPASELSNSAVPKSPSDVLLSGPSSSVSGSTVTFTATVNGSGPTGTVAFKVGGVDIVGCEATALAGAIAVCTTNALSLGVHTLTAVYGGNLANLGSTSAELFHNVLAPLFPLTVERSGAGSGTVLSNPTGITCGVDCSEEYAAGAVVTLVATPGPGQTFSGWSGAGCSGTGPCVVTMDSAKTVTATFVIDLFLVQVSVAGSGSGTLTSDPVGINCGVDCSESLASGTVITLTATPAAGAGFGGWSGVTCAGGNSAPTCSFTLLANTIVTATFDSSLVVTNDFNDDARSDLLWRNGGDGSVQGWLMNGLAATQVAGLLPAGGYTVTHVADLDGNGKADTLIRHTDGTTIGWLHDGLNVVGQATFFAAGSGWSIKHTADLNGDGKADLIVENTDGTVIGWLMNRLTVTGTATFVPAGTGWSVSRVGDLNGDGKADLIWQNSNGTVQAWLMDGLSATQTATFVGAGTGWSVKLIGDFNGDNKADLVWQNTDGTVQAWLMDGTAITQIASFVPAGTGWSPVLAGDIDGDGKADLFWEHTDGRSQTWLMNGLTVASLAGFVGAGGWKATHLLDLNGDGKKDVLWKHTDGTVQGWLLNGLTITQFASLAGAGSYVVIPPRE